MYCIQCFLKSKYIKSRTCNDKNRWIINKVMVFKKLLQHLATRGITPQGIEGAMKRDVSKHWCTLQWCASRGWFIAHENWTSCLNCKTRSRPWLLLMPWYGNVFRISDFVMGITGHHCSPPPPIASPTPPLPPPPPPPPPPQGRWRGTLMCSLVYSWANGWVSNREAGNFRCHRAHYIVTGME